MVDLERKKYKIKMKKWVEAGFAPKGATRPQVKK